MIGIFWAVIGASMNFTRLYQEWGGFFFLGFTGFDQVITGLSIETGRFGPFTGFLPGFDRPGELLRRMGVERAAARTLKYDDAITDSAFFPRPQRRIEKPAPATRTLKNPPNETAVVSRDTSLSLSLSFSRPCSVLEL